MAKKKRKRRKNGAGGAYLSAEAADCLSPGPSSNLSGCPFNGHTFVDADLSSSRMVGTRFRGANLCSATLSSSNLKNADFRGTGTKTGQTDLRRADLSASACQGVKVDSQTLFCRTLMGNGTIRDDDCPGEPDAFCCVDADCPAGQQCDGGECGECTGSTACGARPDGGTLHCCNGTCPTPSSCLSAGVPCGASHAGCAEVCCTGQDEGSHPNLTCEQVLTGTHLATTSLTHVCTGQWQRRLKAGRRPAMGT